MQCLRATVPVRLQPGYPSGRATRSGNVLPHWHVARLARLRLGPRPHPLGEVLVAEVNLPAQMRDPEAGVTCIFGGDQSGVALC